jgi:TonB family protein
MNKYKHILFVLILSIESTLVFGQTDSLKHCKCNTDSLISFGVPERMATFTGGNDELLRFIKQSIRYPAEAIDSKHEDRVIVKFCIRDDGEITDIKILRGKYEELNNEAIRIVKSMPRWQPAMHRGKTICTNFILPFNFNLKLINKDSF